MSSDLTTTLDTPSQRLDHALAAAGLTLGDLCRLMGMVPWDVRAVFRAPGVRLPGLAAVVAPHLGTTQLWLLTGLDALTDDEAHVLRCIDHLPQDATRRRALMLLVRAALLETT